MTASCIEAVVFSRIDEGACMDMTITEDSFVANAMVVAETLTLNAGPLSTFNGRQIDVSSCPKIPYSEVNAALISSEESHKVNLTPSCSYATQSRMAQLKE